MLMLYISLANPLFAQDVVLERVYPNITINNPVDLQHANDGSGRIFVVRQSGIIYVLDDDQTVTTPPVFMNISSRVRSGGERGLLGLAFHPGYAENGFFYVHYTAETNNQLRSVISRFSVDADNPDQGDTDSEFVLLEFDQPYSNHNAGQIAFGPDDGFLYITSGDGGSGGDPDNNAQDRSNLLGTILRIDVDNTQGDLNYSIPSGNPFAGNTDGYREEIYAWGLRNPWRMSFDPETGWLWAADVGQNRVEEINIIENGGNYGWRIMEGSTCFSPSTGCDTTGLILPIWEYTHASGDGRSITGGYVYRGNDYPELQGKYFYSDYVSANMWMLAYDGINEPVNTPLPNPGFAIASFGTDQNGELYAMGHQNGQIYRIKIADAIPLPGTPVLISPEDGVTGRPLELFFAWQAAADAETYRIQIAADPGFGTVDFDIQNITATSVQVGEFEYETTYYWRVRALNETGAGQWSAVRSFTTEDEPVELPDAPELISPADSATGLSVISVNLTWSWVSGADTYEVQLWRTPDFEPSNSVLWVSAMIDTFIPSPGLDYATTYYWRARAENQAGAGEWSAVRSFTTEDAPLEAPEAPLLASPDNAATDLPIDELTFRWFSVEQADNYNLQLASTDDFAPAALLLDMNELSDTTAQAGELEYESTYFWRVRAVNAAGPGEWSIARYFITEDEPLQVPDAPVLVSPTNGAADVDPDIDLEWESVGEAVWYSIQVSKDPDFLQESASSDSLVGLQYSLNALTGLTTYYWRVRAVNMAGPGDWSETWAFTTRQLTSIDSNYSEIPREYELEQNFPNPFNPSTRIRIGVPADAGPVKLEVFDLLGRKVATLVDRSLPAGWQVITFDADNLNSGIYLYRLEAAGQITVKKMMLLK